jgi:hypothetical protein
MDNRIKVGLRIRPLLEKEKVVDPKQPNASATAPIWSESNGRLTVGADNRTRNTFSYDWCYDANSQSTQLYEEMCLPLVTKVFEGYNATFFACKLSIIEKSLIIIFMTIFFVMYTVDGQTGSGKTFTMGNTADCEQGVIPSAVETIFKLRQRCQQELQQKVLIEISYLEIYTGKGYHPAGV